MRIYLDANALIQAVEKSGREADAFVSVVQGASRSGLELMTSELSLAELLVKPIRDRDFQLIAAFNNLLSGEEDGQLIIIPVSREILLSAAGVRANHAGLKLPDAIHIASAEHANCASIITADKRLAGSTRLPVWNPIGADLPAFIEMFS